MSAVLNVAAYRFVAIDDVDALVARVQVQADAGGLRGTVLVAPEGINLFLAGAPSAIRAFLAWLGGDARFAGIEVKFSESEAMPFRRLRVRRKREIITFRDESLAPAAARAAAVAPARLRAWLEAGRDDDGRELVLLDTRNEQETAYGTFAGALTLPIRRFTDMPAALEPHRDALAGKTIVSFCTGGIRCEKAALWMARAGFEHVLQLDGGILGYFEQVGGDGFDGACFVFDDRVALDPRLQPLAAAGADAALRSS